MCPQCVKLAGADGVPRQIESERLLPRTALNSYEISSLRHPTRPPTLGSLLLLRFVQRANQQSPAPEIAARHIARSLPARRVAADVLVYEGPAARIEVRSLRDLVDVEERSSL